MLANATSVADRARPLEWPSEQVSCMGPMQVSATVSGPSSVGHWGGLKPQKLLQKEGVGGHAGRRGAADEALSIKTGRKMQAAGAWTSLHRGPLVQSFA